MPEAILIVDSSVLINFLCIKRIDLLASYPAQILITEHVRDEITSEYQDQLDLLNQAIEQEVVRVEVITNIEDLIRIAEVQRMGGAKRLGVGECSAIAIAAARGFELAMEDRVAIIVAQDLFPDLRIYRTDDLMLRLIQLKLLSIEDADRIKKEWETVHRFATKVKSFRDLV